MGDAVVVNELFGDAASMFNFAKGGNDTLTGGDNFGAGDRTSGRDSNFLVGDAYTNVRFRQGRQRHPDWRR